MFLGTIEPPIRDFLAAHSKVFAGKIVAVGCSGNFTSERVLWSATDKNVQLHSNDVSLYSSLIGAHLAGDKLQLGIKEPQYNWLNEYFAPGGWRRIAAFLVFYSALEYEAQKNPYTKRIWDGSMTQFPHMVKETEKKLEALTLNINSYYAGDCLAFFKHMEKKHGKDVIYTSYMPFFTGGYETIYKRVEEIFHWDEKPEYPLLDDERRLIISNWAAQRNHITLLNFPLEDQEPVLLGHTRRNVHVYMYSNMIKKSAVYRRKRPDDGIRVALLTENEKITEDTELKITMISSALIQPYKGMFLAKNIDYSTGMYAFAISMHGKVIGFLEYSFGTIGGGTDWYLFSDFPVGDIFHKRQSKLIAMLSLCSEVEKSLREKNLRLRTHVSMTAWTKKAVSMKYRGVFKKIKRDEKRGLINYRQKFTGMSAQETFQLWTKKYKIQF